MKLNSCLQPRYKLIYIFHFASLLKSTFSLGRVTLFASFLLLVGGCAKSLFLEPSGAGRFGAIVFVPSDFAKGSRVERNRGRFPSNLKLCFFLWSKSQSKAESLKALSLSFFSFVFWITSVPAFSCLAACKHKNSLIIHVFFRFRLSEFSSRFFLTIFTRTHLQIWLQFPSPKIFLSLFTSSRHVSVPPFSPEPPKL